MKAASCSRRAFFAALLLAPVAALRAAARDDVHVYLTVDQALKEVFPASARYITETVVLSASQQTALARSLGRRDLEPRFEVALCYNAAGRFLGYAVITDELGKYQPITFMTGIRPSFEVEKVAVMVYRESRGGEVRMPRFLYQYRGKTAADPLRINRDIINITGATISVRALNAGVKKVLSVVAGRYRADPPAPDFEAERRTLGGGARG